MHESDVIDINAIFGESLKSSAELTQAIEGSLSHINRKSSIGVLDKTLSILIAAKQSHYVSIVRIDGA